MFEYKKQFDPSEIMCDPDNICPDNCLLVNIETTGLSPRNAFVYMTGCLYRTGDNLQMTVWITENKTEEREMLEKLAKLAVPFEKLITFGGHSFSYRFLKARMYIYFDVDPLFSTGLKLCDIQKDLAEYKDLIGLESTRKPEIEKLLGIKREGIQTGRELIEVYETYERNGDETSRSSLLQHSEEDLLSLYRMMTLRPLISLLKGSLPDELTLNVLEDRCMFTLTLPHPSPIAVHFSNDIAVIGITENRLVIEIPFFIGELKFFLPGPVNDYYYLPYEDTAIHRSVARYTDKTHRKKATAQTCYIRRRSVFIPSPDDTLYPVFQESYRSHPLYIEFQPEEWFEDLSKLRSFLKRLFYV